jgi:hypothetical protein
MLYMQRRNPKHSGTKRMQNWLNAMAPALVAVAVVAVVAEDTIEDGVVGTVVDKDQERKKTMDLHLLLLSSVN